ncbi:hypothetical protein BVRB_7g162860 [Beta vulgaris subsp. vulgaris]|nr:hypothetical protein BVRB_7g162860 [Beta vulgaris subsp. vulgaris]
MVLDDVFVEEESDEVTDKSSFDDDEYDADKEENKGESEDVAHDEEKRLKDEEMRKVHLLEEQGDNTPPIDNNAREDYQAVSSLRLGFAKIRPTNWGNYGHACASPLVVRASEKRENLTQQKPSLSVEECEAAVVAGNAPSAALVPPRSKAPAGTPVISPLSRRYFRWSCWSSSSMLIHKDKSKLNGSVDGKQECTKDGKSDNIAVKTFTFCELAVVTRNFRVDYLVGEGGFGRVYKGQLENSCQVVAIKRLDHNGLQGNREFLVEAALLILLMHPTSHWPRHLVPMMLELGYDDLTQAKRDKHAHSARQRNHYHHIGSYTYARARQTWIEDKFYPSTTTDSTSNATSIKVDCVADWWCSMHTRHRDNKMTISDPGTLKKANAVLAEEITEKVTEKLTASFNAVLTEYGLSALRQPKLDRPLKDKASHPNTQKSAPSILELEVTTGFL